MQPNAASFATKPAGACPKGGRRCSRAKMAPRKQRKSIAKCSKRRSRRVSTSVAAFALASSLCLVVAHGEPPPAPPAASTDQETQARRLYEQGQARYNLGDYDTAIARFSEAYELSPAPI